MVHFVESITSSLPNSQKSSLSLLCKCVFKKINDLIEPNSLVLTFLIFDNYPYMTNMDAPSSSINQHSIAIYKAIEEVQRSYASCQVNDVLNTPNGLFTSLIYDLPLNLPVLGF